MTIEPAKATITRDPVLVDLALQGGGSHGAFTWGFSIVCSKSPGLKSTVFPARRPAR